MSFKYIQEIPAPETILKDIPVSEDLKKLKAARDRQIRDVFEGNTEKFVLIVGPCSADNEDSVCDYNLRLRKLQDKVKDKVLIIPRIYTNKPRTTGSGYKGMAHQPNPAEEPDMVKGLEAIRRLHIRSLRETGLPAADEMLYPENYPYLADLLSYVAIGARSVENQQHRLTISGLDIPAGMKNPTSGNLTVMFNSIQAAQLPHVFSYNRWAVKTSGNPLCHAVIRGATDHYGRSIPNYHYEELVTLSEMYEETGLKNPAIIVDTNHANSNKKFSEQPRIAMEILHSRRRSPLLGKMIKGLMVESYIEEGCQKIGDGVFGKSITDPCLGWAATEKLIQDIAEILGKQ
ncbi:MAG TPA: 3-deoxy-7-phosphoheptulonate synthase [Candidatus Omnitrophota bacterium]|nr:3-deoxy-7-phosphoheptulonate synthase [Candidatus Omnitrophota bacterium]